MYLRVLTLVLVCCGLGFGGYELSNRRALLSAGSPSDVIAAAGGDPSFIGSGEGNQDGEAYRISALSVFSNVALHVKDNYVDPDRIDPKAMLLSALREVERQIAEVLVEELGNGQVRVRVMQQEKILRIDDVANLWEINLRLRDVFRFLEKSLPPQKDMRAIEYAAVNGALSTLDPHSVLLKPEAFAEMKTSTKGEFGGLGIVISVKDAKLTIVSPLEGTPAWRAGLKAGDAISRIGDVSTVSMPIEEAVRMLRGPEGSKVTIWIERKGWSEPRKFTIMRERIKIESVEGHLLSDNVGYIKIKNFQQNTGKDLEDQLAKLTTQSAGKLRGLVLDLRNNPGGLLEQAIRVSDKFLTSGDIVTTVGYGNKLREPKRARWSGTEAELPIAVVVNKGSASASEIVAGALKNLDRAVILGERTFGKGSVQVLYDFADSSALKLTIAQYLTPGGISIQNEGVGPDIELHRAWVEESSVRLFHKPQGHRESSLDKHLERGDAPGPSDPNPIFSLNYLIDREESEVEEEGEETKAFVEDYPVKLAREFLTAVGDPSRAKMLQSGMQFLRERAAVEEDRTIAKMKKLGIDWSERSTEEARADTSSNVDVSFEVLAPFSDGVVPAGSELKLSATVRNTGDVPVHRLRGVLEAENGAFRGREFLFGKVAPGKTRSWTVSTRIPKDSASRSDLLTLKLEADTGPLAVEPQRVVHAKYVEHPQFSYSYAFDDSERGDGDGVLESGEGVDFLVFVTNTGAGDADDVSLRLKSGAGEALFLERGRASLEKIAAGATATGHLRFRVRKGTGQEPEKLPLELSIYDAGTGEWLEDEFSIVSTPAKPDSVRPLKGSVTTRRDTPLFAASREDGPMIAVAKRGSRLDRLGQIGDFVKVALPPSGVGWLRAKDVAPASGRVTTSGEVAALGVSFEPQRRPPTIVLETDIGGSMVEGKTVALAGEVRARSLRDMYIVLNDRKIFFGVGRTDTTPDPFGSALARDGALYGESDARSDREQRAPADGAPPHAATARGIPQQGALAHLGGAGPASGESASASTSARPGQSATIPSWTRPEESRATLPFRLDLDLKEGLNKVVIVARLDERVMSYKNLFVSRRAVPPAVAEASTDRSPGSPRPTP